MPARQKKPEGRSTREVGGGISLFVRYEEIPVELLNVSSREEIKFLCISAQLERSSADKMPRSCNNMEPIPNVVFLGNWKVCRVEKEPMTL
jgi:hypothetical protein